MTTPNSAGSAPELDDLYLSLEGFAKRFEEIHSRNPDRSFAFVLGAGASVSSGIPAAGTLARRWLEQLYVESRDFGSGVGQEQWLRENRCRIDEFDADDPAAAYPFIYARRFGQHPEEGYADLEDVMSRGSPRFGYAVLAHVLANTRHKVVVTTNFDNLVADSLAVFAGVTPIVCGHDALAGFAKPNPRRPLVLKVHHDLLLAPRNTPAELRELGSRFREAVERLFRHYTPIVIGYGGNDVSFMSVLAGLAERSVQSGIYWCYRESDKPPGPPILDVVGRQAGRVVPIPDFDELMAWLAPIAGYDSPVDRLVEKAQVRAREIALHTEQLQTRLREREQRRTEMAAAKSSDAVEAPALNSALDSLKATLRPAMEPKSEWDWFALAQSQKDDAGTEQVYERALLAMPESAPLLGSYALFLAGKPKDHGRAEALFSRAIEANPRSASNLGNYANFLADRPNDYDRAEEFYRRAVDANPRSANNLGNYANFLVQHRVDHDRAEEFYSRAIEVDPTHANNLGNFANFLRLARMDDDRAEEFYRRALEADPTHTNNLGNYALLLERREQFDRAEEIFRRALEADHTHTNTLANFTRFLIEHRGVDQYREMLSRAIQSLGPTAPSAVDVEVWFYAFAVGDEELQARGIRRLKRLLTVDLVRSPGWNLTQIVDSPGAAAHPDRKWLSPLASVITEGAAVDTLSGWKRWRDTSPE